MFTNPIENNLVLIKNIRNLKLNNYEKNRFDINNIYNVPNWM